MKIALHPQFGAKLQKSAKIGHLYWLPANSIGAQSEISYSIFLESFLCSWICRKTHSSFIGPHPECFDRRTIRVSQRQHAKAAPPCLGYVSVVACRIQSISRFAINLRR
jgi:hypothetical protein